MRNQRFDFSVRLQNTLTPYAGHAAKSVQAHREVCRE